MIGPIMLLIVIALAALGVALARTPLRRPAYWLRWGLMAAAFSLLAVIIGYVFYSAHSVGAPGDRVYDAFLLLPTILVSLSYATAIVFAFLWQGRRMLDARGEKWWAMLGLLPFAFIVIGALPSRPAGGLRENEALEVFR